jgi:hypothetical protein
VTSFDLDLAALDAGAIAQRLEAIDQALFGLRAFLAEVERVRPGLVIDRIDGWHSVAADLYSGRAAEVRYSLAGAEQLLRDAEAELVAARERVQAVLPAGPFHAPPQGDGPTPADPVAGATHASEQRR